MGAVNIRMNLGQILWMLLILVYAAWLSCALMIQTSIIFHIILKW